MGGPGGGVLHGCVGVFARVGLGACLVVCVRVYICVRIRVLLGACIYMVCVYTWCVCVYICVRIRVLLGA